ncbi:MAG TPA: hypothetical protein VGE43_16495 [Acidimicrobiales bacterium]
MSREITETTASATVTSASPDLWIVVDGATVPCPAYVLDVAAYTVGQRVRVTVRNPQIPVVQGVES